MDCIEYVAKSWPDPAWPLSGGARGGLTAAAVQMPAVDRKLPVCAVWLPVPDALRRDERNSYDL